MIRCLSYRMNRFVTNQPKTQSPTHGSPHTLKGLMSVVLCGLCLTTLTFLEGCSSRGDKAGQLSEQAYYTAAQEAIDSENYVVAVEQLEQLESRFPFGRYSVQTQLDLIYAYYQSLDYTSAALQAERFIRQNTTHPDVDYAYYMKGLANFSTDRGLMARILPTKPSQRNITPIRAAFSDFSQLLNKFPKSRYAPDARQRMIYLRNLLAENELLVARYYVERRAYIAALNRAKTILEQYPQTPSVPDAMVMVTRMYEVLGMNELAADSLKLLRINYPNHPELDENGHLKRTNLSQGNASLTSRLTFGLIK